MARNQTDDLIQSFRFRVIDTPEEGEGYLPASAGFNNVTTPTVTVEAAEYREGNRKYTLKQPGVPSVEALTLTRGIAKAESSFAEWMLEKLLGGAPYRSDITVQVFDQVNTGESDTDIATKELNCKEAFPTSVKLIGDLDATSSDINIQEIECAVEEIGYKNSTTPETV